VTFVGTAAPVPVRILRPVGLILRGTFLLPEAAKGRVPGVLLLSGSGPTDRNGNQLPAIASDLLKQIAERLGIFDPAGGYLFGGELFVGEESPGHNSSAEVLGFSQTGTEAFSSTFHFSGTGGSGIEALVNGLAVQPNGEIVAVGEQITFAQSGTVTVNGLARLSPAGILDPTFGSGGTVVNNLPASSAVVIQPNAILLR